MSEFTRNCPKCNRVLSYSCKDKLNRANKQNSKCLKCGNSDNHKKKWPDPPYVKICPGCKIELTYSRFDSLQNSIKKNSVCRKCSDDTYDSVKVARKNPRPPHSKEQKKKMSAIRTGKVQSEETKQKRGIYRKGRKRTEETKRKLRLSRIKYNESKFGQLSPNYNISACKIFSEINEVLKWNGVHAENGGEYRIHQLGYWVDYYEPTQNIVIEFDEKYHIRQAKKDAIRQEQITKQLGCKFYRLTEKQSWREVLNDYISN